MVAPRAFVVAVLGCLWSTAAHATPSVARPTHLSRLVCSMKEPLCVHGDPRLNPKLVERVTTLVEESTRALRTLDLPSALGDTGQAGSFDHDIYLLKAHDGAASYPDPRPPDGHRDRSSTFTLLTDDLPDDCRGANHIARAMAQASLLAIDPAIHPGVLSLGSSYLGSLISSCPGIEASAIAFAQRRPDLPLTESRRQHYSGAAPFAAYLDQAYGDDSTGSVFASMIGIASQTTDPGPLSWNNEPDFFDALRLATEGHDFTLGDLLLDYAVTRAFFGSADDDRHLKGTQFLGPLGPARKDWTLPIESFPRRLAPSYPLSVTGSAYIAVRIPDKYPGGLRLNVDWETGMNMRWAVVLRDGEGREIRRHTAPGVVGRAYTQLTVVRLHDAREALIVGTSVGSDNRQHPYDPDDGPARVVSYVATLQHLPGMVRPVSPEDQP